VRSVVLTSTELVEIRAAQRTFEGAYVRTAIGQFSFALIVLKIFTAEFYSIGALFAVYGAGILFISLFRRQQGTLSMQTRDLDGVDLRHDADGQRQETNNSFPKSAKMACTARSSEPVAMWSRC
jgi:hypothetical protein